MSDTDHAEKAKTALDAASQALRNPAAGSYENANAIALIAIGHALLEVAHQIRRSD